MNNDPNFERNIDGIQTVSPHVSVHYGTPKQDIKELPQKRKSHPWLWVSLLIVALFLGSAAGLVYVVNKWSAGSFVGSTGGFFKNAADLIRGSAGQVAIQGEQSGVVRILLLGIGGEGHDGPYLSDTIILAQIKLDTGEVSLTSIPRDYQVKLGTQGYRKINFAFSEGYTKNKNWNEAGQLARDVVSDISGLDIPYFAVVDFSGFEQAVNQVGGLDVTVQRTFTDYQYPDNKDGYLPPQTFTAGAQHFDGTKALIFARSRHAAGPEGSDFSRSQRQQLIIGAFQDKVKALNLFTDTATLSHLFQTFASHFHTNLTPGQLLRLAKIGSTVNKNNITSTSLDPSTGLVCPEITVETKAYVLVPCAGKTTDDIKSYFANSLTVGKLTKEKSVVWIATTSPNAPAYKRISANLEEAGITVWPINYNDVEPETSVIYQINSKPFTATFIKDLLKAREVTVPPPNIRIDSSRSDIILILGTTLPSRFTKPLPITTPEATPSIDLNTLQ